MHFFRFPLSLSLLGGGGFTSRQTVSDVFLRLIINLTDSPDCLIENCLKSFLSECRALKILHGPNVTAHGNALRVCDG